MKPRRYIAVDGPIGAGKTSLAKLLAEEFQSQAVLEKVDENPFLRRFYDEPERWRFHTQVHFLLTRHRQQIELAQPDRLQHNVVVDYLFRKDLLFAEKNLSAEEFSLYKNLYSLLVTQVPKPDLVVYLEARVDVLLSRVRKRAADYERHITPEYISQIAEAYRNFFFDYDETPLLVVNCSEIDFVENSDDTENLIREIREMKQGVQHYIPLGSRSSR